MEKPKITAPDAKNYLEKRYDSSHPQVLLSCFGSNRADAD
jgi:hypothetical protein